MERIWLQSYPKGVPADINPDEYKSLVDLFEESARKYADLPAFHNLGKTITFGELERSSRAFGAWLQAKGMVKGSRVAIMTPNCLQFPIAMFGALRAGCTVVNVNPLYTARELEHQLKDSGAEVIVVLENYASVLQEVLAHTQVKHVIVTSLGELLGLKGIIVNFVVRRVKKMVPVYDLPKALSFTQVLDGGSDARLVTPDLKGDDIAYLQYTGGTTGVAKGAMLLHRNVVAAMLQYKAWLTPAFGSEAPVIVTALPLYHIFSLTVNCLVMCTVGGCNILITNPRDIPGFVKELRKHKYTMLTGVNTLFNALLNNPDFVKLDFSHVKLVVGGGMAVQKAVADRWKEVTGLTLIEGYGLTETAPSATANPLDLKEYSGSIGVPMPSTIISIRDDDGKEVKRGDPGEICISGPQVMAGYWQRPEETAQVMTADGFLKTGDIGVMDEKGFIRIVDRKKDMILVSGFNVYPNEVEQVVAMHPGVLEVAAVGVPDGHSGEAVKLFIVKKDAKLTEADITEFCKKELTGYKRPKHIEFRAELPKTNVGKILRRALRDEVKATG